MTVAMIGKQLCILKYTSGSVLKTSGVKKLQPVKFSHTVMKGY